MTNPSLRPAAPSTRPGSRPEDEQRGSIGTAVLGGGPAGLTAAYTLGLRGKSATVFEGDGIVGGIAKTVEFKGYRFDLGGHRFFTKMKPIEKLWEHVMGEEFLTRPRLSRIFYNGKFFSYPLRARDVVGRLGVVESTRCALSYMWSARHRGRTAETFEEWVTTRFGRRLYDAFFRSYTEKVWGIPGSEIRSQWAAQRIRDFSLWKAMLSILGIRQSQVTTLIEEFRYPRLGPGQMWETFAKRITDGGIDIEMQTRSTKILHGGSRVTGIVVDGPEGAREHEVEGLLSSIPLSQLVQQLEPAAPPEVLEAAARLRYRDFVLVALMTDEEEPFPDNWIYLHDPETRAGRVQNFGAWSKDMVRPGTTCLGVEYFCFEGDETWNMSEKDAIDLARTELGNVGLIDPSRVFDGARVQVRKAYPMYDSAYVEAVAVLRAHVARFENLQTFGRNGLHRYNNQDHSMWTAILATLNLLDGANYDLWDVNNEADYIEEGAAVDEALDLGAPSTLIPRPLQQQYEGAA